MSLLYKIIMEWQKIWDCMWFLSPFKCYWKEFKFSHLNMGLKVVCKKVEAKHDLIAIILRDSFVKTFSSLINCPPNIYWYVCIECENPNWVNVSSLSISIIINGSEKLAAIFGYSIPTNVSYGMF